MFTYRKQKNQFGHDNVIACIIGAGLIAGVGGTAAITLAQMIEMKISGRKPSDTPARAGAKVLGVEPRTEEDKERFNNLVHWCYGSMWGIFRADLLLLGMRKCPATILHFFAIWLSGMVFLPQLKVSPPPWKWGWKALAMDIVFHIVYALGAGVVFDKLIKRR
ncbi:MAG: hypothetical protein ACOCW2_01185 [Chitinivibrionales bacterium]